jgi:hypothetical protein
MMLPTHVVVGLAVAAPLIVLTPDYAAAALAGGVVGSVLPDLDMYAGHRRTLHYPTGYTLTAVPAAIAGAALQTPLSVALTFALGGAALHCRMDRYGGGLEREPWEATSDRAVYDHARGRWQAPKRWVRYDGAPEDVLFVLVLGAPVTALLDPPFQWVAGAALLIGAAYGLLRRRLAALAPVVFERVPAPVSGYVPDRYRR